MISSAILETLNDFELRCVVNDFSNPQNDINLQSGDPLIKSLNVIRQCLVEGDYETVLQMNLEALGFHVSTRNYDNPQNFISDLFNDTDDERQTKAFVFMFIAVCALQEFVRCNFCGPMTKVENYQIVSDLFPDDVFPESKAVSLLSLDGENIYSNVVHPKLLYFSFVVLSDIELSESITHKWWLLRCTTLRQAVLPERNETLHKSAVSLIREIQQMDWILIEKKVSKKVVVTVECCQIFLRYGEIVSARKCLTEAQSIIGLEIELSGAMGKRTQYQQKPVAQLFVKVQRKHHNFTGIMLDDNTFLPKDLQLQDDILLNKVKFVDGNEQPIEQLCAEEQIVLLGYCSLLRKSGCFDELLQEETMSYVNCLLSQPQIWSVYLKALIIRCRAEKNSSRRIERAVMQMEAIVKCLKETLPPVREREKYFFCTTFPPFWILEKNLADLLLEIGCTKSALEIYERLELWEEIVDCYIRLGRTSSAEKILRIQLEKGENTMLWCLLGDVTENTEFYLKAWEVSDHRSARAQRSLGYYYFKRKEYKKSVPHFVESLEINHLQPEAWFSLGHAATQVEDFELAARAYRQVVLFDEDNFEAWNNLANAYIKTKQKVRAWRSLQEALKCNYEEWRVWENFLLVSTDIGAFEDALRAWHRLLDVKGKFCDTLLLEILVKAVIENLPDISDCPSSRLRKRTLELLGRITSVTTNEPRVWELYSSLTHSSVTENGETDILEKAVLYQQKALCCYIRKESWESDFELCKDVLVCAEKVAELKLDFVKVLDGNRKTQQKASARLNLQGVISRVKKFVDFFCDIEKNEISDKLKSLRQLLDDILNL